MKTRSEIADHNEPFADQDAQKANTVLAAINPYAPAIQNQTLQLAIALIWVLLLPAMACAQEVTGPALKAAFIYNLAKFTEWPDEAPPAKPFVMCVLGDAAVSQALEGVVKDRLLAGRSITIVFLAASEPQRSCHLLYLSGIPAGQAAQLLESLRGAPVLTISDLKGFAELGGIVQFFFEYGQLRFSIRPESVKIGRLLISAKVLTLAKQK